ncbi:hypothetical protein ASG03_04670 [Rhizobium sp. Leaf341]|nr:hypothetical protein ASG03_04670 [Rhizobium sp. Leaf341]
MALGLALSIGGAGASQAQQLYDLNIPGGDLATVVTRIARETGTSIAFPSGLAKGRTTGPIAGRTSVRAALDRALSGTGLLAVTAADGNITIRPGEGASQAPAAKLGSDVEVIDVADAGNTNTFGDDGFKAGAAGDSVRIADAPAKDIPIAVTGVTKKVIESQGLTSSLDAARNAAGVSLGTTSEGGGRPKINIRGFNNAGYSVEGQKPGELFGSYGYDPTMPIDDVERVEVLKGPTSILTGRTDPGGSVNVVLKRPTEETIRDLTVRYGTFQDKTIALDFGGLIPDTEGLSYRFVTSGRHAKESYGGYADPHEVLVAPSIQWKGDDASVLVGGSYTDQFQAQKSHVRLSTIAGLGMVEGPMVDLRQGLRLGGQDFGLRQKVENLYSEQSYDIGDLLDNTITFNNRIDYTHNATKGDVLRYVMRGDTDFDPSTLAFQARRLEYYEHTLSDKADVTAKYDGDVVKNTLKLGYDYQGSDLDYGYGGTFPVDLNVTTGLPKIDLYRGPLKSKINVDTTTHGIYAVDKMDLNDQVHLFGLLRRDFMAQDERRASTVQSSADADSQATTSWTLGATWDLTDWASLYVNRSIGYVPGGFGKTSIDAPSAFVAPEGSNLKEVGMRFAFFEDRLKVSTALYDLLRTNVTIANPDDPSGFGTFLIPAQHTRGVELEVQGEITPNLNLILGASHLNSSAPQDVLPSPAYAGIPQTTGSLWAVYTFDDTVPMLENWQVGAGVRGVSKSFATSTFYPNGFNIPGYVIADASIGYKAADWSIDMKINNLFDTDAIVPLVSGPNYDLEARRGFLLQMKKTF